MTIGQLMGRKPEERKCASRLEMNPNDRRLFSGIGHKKYVVGSRNDCAGKALVLIRLRSFVNPEFITPQVKYEFEGTAWKNPLLEMGRIVTVIQPQVFNEVGKGRSRFAGTK
jgi:hypothetical protein